MFRTATLSLLGPKLEKVRFVANVTAFLGPNPDRLPTDAVERAETAQFPELLRELRDFR